MCKMKQSNQMVDLTMKAPSRFLEKSQGGPYEKLEDKPQTPTVHRPGSVKAFASCDVKYELNSSLAQR